MSGFIERRLSPRVCVLPGEVIRFDLRQRVRLLDLSMTGALVACDMKLPVGTEGQFSAGLAAVPFTADVVLNRHHPRPAPNGQIGVGAAFTSMDERNRTHLEQFLSRASE